MNRLDQEIARLVEHLRPWQPALAWTTIQVVEAADVQFMNHVIHIPPLVLGSPAAYAGRFAEHLQAGYSWINLQAAGVVEGVLIVIVEVPRNASGVPGERVAVNLSGPPAGGRIELAAIDQPIAVTIARACEQFLARTIDAHALVQRLTNLTAGATVPASLASEIDSWRAQLEAALQWAQTDEERGLGRAVGIAIALQAWAKALPADAAAGNAVQSS